MATFTRAGDLARHQRERTERLYRSILAASEESARIAREEAEKLTSGTTSTRELTQAGHPFARARGANRFGGRGRGTVSLMRSYPLVPINEQSGRLRRSWRIFRRRDPEKGSVAFQLQNIAPESKYVLAPGGTARMIDRGFWNELNRRVLPKIRRKHLDIWRAALRG
jgi:hypothetical protein